MIRTCTTKYVTLLSVVLALALTAALAACGSDEPSGVTGPDRIASTPTETPASPTATVAPRPTASDSAARGLRLRRNGSGSLGCLLQRNDR